MSENITFRARFPDGRNLTLSLPFNTTYAALLSTLQERASLSSIPEKVLIAGPPPTPVNASSDTQLSFFLTTGDSIIVEPKSGPPARARRGRKAKKTMVERANEQLKKRASTSAAPNAKRPRVATLANMAKKPSSSKKVAVNVDDFDDPNDVNWTADLEEDDDEDDSDDNDTVTKQQSNATTRRRGPIRNARRNAGSSSNTGGIDPLDINAAQGEIGAALLKSFLGDGSNGMGKTFRESLQNALKDKMAETKGDRRVSAWRSKNYRFTDVVPGGFLVEFKGFEERKWEKDFDGHPCIIINRAVLKAAFVEIVNGGDQEKLKEIEMAKVSPRIFWNMVRLFPNSVEDGLREIAPDINWDFLDVRKRTLSRKAQRNLENKREMGWTSD